MGSRNIKIVLAYDGTDFLGWQRQKSGRTVQAVVEEALATMHKERVQVHAAGRTDSGVHAAGQVINFKTGIDSMPAERFTPALNSLLPFDVRALESVEAGESFHARFDAKLREYRYYVYPSPIVPPYCRRYCHWIAFKPDLRKLNAMAAMITGEHDFTSFTALGDPNPSKVRDVSSAAFFPEGAFIVFRVAGGSFLWKMVRNLAGTMLDLAAKGFPPERFAAILAGRDRDLAGETAPAQGLFLHKVEYE